MGREVRLRPGDQVKERLANPIYRWDAISKLEKFLVAAVVMILIIRTQLWLTNYPQLGGGGIHIAHLLWGGLFMLVAIWFSLIWVNRWARNVAAVLGGIGFGFFIDELGKFVTEDNDYFFKPAAPIIYLVFIVLFLVIRHLSGRIRVGPEMALANVLDLLPATVTGEFGRREKEEADRLLESADQSDPRVEAVRGYLKTVELSPERPPSRLGRIIERARGALTGFTEWRLFEPLVVTVLIVWAVSSAAGVLEVQFNFGDLINKKEDLSPATTDVVEWGRSISVLLSALFVGLGVLQMLRSHHQAAYRHFTTALLISIFLTRVFVFLEAQFAAVFGLGFDLLLLGAISMLAARDRQQGQPTPARHPAPTG